MITNDHMDSLFHALAHTTRREIMDHVRGTPGITVGLLAAKFDVSRIAVMNHLAVLEKADLVISRKDGKSRRLYLNTTPIQEIHNRWTDDYSAHWADRTLQIKSIAEAVARQTKGPHDD